MAAFSSSGFATSSFSELAFDFGGATPPPDPTPNPGTGGGGGHPYTGMAGQGHYSAYPVGDSRVKEVATQLVEKIKAPAKDHLSPFMLEMQRMDAIREELLLRKENLILQRKLELIEDDEDFMAILMSMPFN